MATHSLGDQAGDCACTGSGGMTMDMSNLCNYHEFHSAG